MKINKIILGLGISVIVLLVAGGGVASIANAQVYTATVEVRDASNSNSLGSAGVIIYYHPGTGLAFQGTADANGRFTFTPITGRDYRFKVSHPNYRPRSFVLTIPLNTYTSMVVPLWSDSATPPPTSYRLSVSKSPTAGGTITSTSPAAPAFNCGQTCGNQGNDFPPRTVVTLVATHASGYTFSGWSGACTNATGNCDVTMSGDKTVTANFTPTYTISGALKNVNGGASITISGGGSCAITTTTNPDTYSCNNIPSGSNVTITPTKSDGTFTPIKRTHNNVIIDNTGYDFTFTATPAPSTLIITKAGTGSSISSVTSSPDGINCGSTCSADFTYNTLVYLTATAPGGYSFKSWSVGQIVSTNNPASILMNTDKDVTANFVGNTLHGVQIRVRKANCTSNCNLSGATVVGHYFTPPLTTDHTFYFNNTDAYGKTNIVNLREGMTWKVGVSKPGYVSRTTNTFDLAAGWPDPILLTVELTSN